ncbi:MAG: hypothetical protein IPJ98_00670 [Bryobacterales bacterium]|nr:hypothetical protein [Bryobacterales bacterium]
MVTVTSCPYQIEVLAKLKEAQGKYAEADQLYQRAHDVIEGAMLNVPSALSAASLVSVMSSVYTSHFRLRSAPEPVGWVADHKAVAIREEFGRLQAKLLVTARPRDRASLLNSLWDAEQRLHLLDGEKFAGPGSRSSPISLGPCVRP